MGIFRGELRECPPFILHSFNYEKNENLGGNIPTFLKEKHFLCMISFVYSKNPLPLLKTSLRF